MCSLVEIVSQIDHMELSYKTQSVAKLQRKYNRLLTSPINQSYDLWTFFYIDAELVQASQTCVQSVTFQNIAIQTTNALVLRTSDASSAQIFYHSFANAS